MPATLHDNPELSRFEMDDDGVLAVANYRLADDLITFTHTEVPTQARGHGRASRLIAGALETGARPRAEGGGTLLLCARLLGQASRISRSDAIRLSFRRMPGFPMQVDLSGLRALVTGSTKGIGRAVAQALAANGAEVVINGRKAADVEQAIASLRAALPKAV